MTARTHRILTVAILALTQIASVTGAVVAALAGAGAIPALWAALIPQVVGDVTAGLVTVLRELQDPTGGPAVLPPPKP